MKNSVVVITGGNGGIGNIVVNKLLKENSKVIVLDVNETNNLEFKRSSTVQIMKFYDILKKNRLNVTIRREFGSKISAACGQLRSKKEEL